MIVACISLCNAMCVCACSCNQFCTVASFRSSYVQAVYIYSNVTVVNVQLNGTISSQTLCQEQQILTIESN